MYHLFIISGPGGGGKDSIIDRVLLNKELNLVKLVSHTTRNKRVGEREEKDYYFLTREEFEREIAKKQMLEYEVMESNHHYYGTHKKQLLDKLNSHNVICKKMPIGALKLAEYFPAQAVTIFIDANDLELKNRLLATDRSIEHSLINRRLEQAIHERSLKNQFQYQINNHDGDLEKTVLEVDKIIRSNIFDSLTKPVKIGKISNNV